jgi:cobalt-zinc-cadmium efflux system outer membrane protein
MKLLTVKHSSIEDRFQVIWLALLLTEIPPEQSPSERGRFLLRQPKISLSLAAKSILAICLGILSIFFSNNNSHASVDPSTYPNSTPSILLPTQPLIQAQASEQTTTNTVERLSLASCFEKADLNNKEIAVAASNISATEAAISIAKAIPNPTYNLAYGFGPAWAYIIAGNNQQFGWTEEIQVAGKRTKKVDVARATYLQSALQLEAVRFDIHNRVRRAYVELAVASAYADLIELGHNTSLKLSAIAQKRFEAGKAPGSEILQAKLNLAQSELQRNQSKGRLLQDSAQLSLLLGESTSNQTVIRVDDSGLIKYPLPANTLVPDISRALPPLADLLPVAWRERNDLKAAIQQAYVDRKLLTLAKSQRIPDPVIGFNYLFSTYKPFQSQYYTSQPNAVKVPYEPGYLLTAVEETPIFNQYKGQINQAKATWIQQLKQNEQQHSQIAADIVTDYEALLVGQENIRKFQKELLPAAQNMAQLARRGYELGKTDLSTSILALQQFQQLRSAYFDSVVSYQNAWADLEKAVGVPLKL